VSNVAADAGVDAVDAGELQCPGPDVDGDEATALRAPLAPVIDGEPESMWESARSVSFINDAVSDNQVVVRLRNLVPCLISDNPSSAEMSGRGKAR
jgi:hypothetical protein